MNVSTHEIGFEAIDALAGVDSLCLFISEDERPLPGAAGYVDWRLCGGLSRVLAQRFFTGARGDKLLLPSERRVAMERIFAVGVGELDRLEPSGLQEVLSTAAHMLSRAGVQAVALELPGAGRLEDAARVEALTRGFLPQFKGSRVAVLADRGVRALLGKG